MSEIFYLTLYHNTYNMRPIDKFEFTYKERNILHYAELASRCCLYEDPYGLPQRIGLDQVTTGSDLSARVCGLLPVMEIFAKRYNERKLTNYFTYEEYLKQNEIQKHIAELGLDIDKFWFLILFVYDFCESICIDGIGLADSAYDQLQRLIETITPHVEKFDSQIGSTLDTAIKMEIRVKGVKGVITIDNPTALHFIADTCAKRMKEAEDWTCLRYQELQYDSKALNDSPYIYYFATMLLKFFDTQESVKTFRKKGAKHSVKERALISRLIHFTKLSKKEIWLTDDEILKSFLKQYKESDFWNRTSNIYPEFLL